MPYVFHNSLDGVLDATLSAAATTMSSPQLADVPAITGGDQMLLVLDPEEENGDPEYVLLTSHAGSGTTGTVTREAENSTDFPDREHPSGTAWRAVGLSKAIIDGILDASLLADDSITNDHLADDAVDTDQLADEAVDGTKIEADAIDGTHISDDTVDSEHIVAGAVDNEHLADDAVDSDEIADGAIDNAHLAADSVDSDNYVDGSIDDEHLASAKYPEAVTVSSEAASFTPAAGEESYYYRITDAATVTLPSNATEAIAIGAQLSFFVTTANAVAFAAGGGATVNASALNASGQYAIVTAVKVDTNEWDLFGNLV